MCTLGTSDLGVSRGVAYRFILSLVFQWNERVVADVEKKEVVPIRVETKGRGSARCWGTILDYTEN